MMLPSSGALPARGGFSWMTALVAAGIVVLVGRRRHPRQGRSRRTAAPPAARRARSSRRRSRRVRRGSIDTFFREADRLLFVGHSTLVDDKADGFTEAEAGGDGRDRQPDRPVDPRSGLDRSSALAVRSVSFQGASATSRRRRCRAIAAELERARRATREGRKRVAESLKKTAAGLAPSERNDLYWEKLQTRDGIKYKVSIRFAVPKATFEKMVESYQTPESAMGAKAVSYFPQLGWRYDITEGAVITHVANDSSLRFAGIEEGDLVLAGMDRVVHDARSWKRVLDEESAALTRDGGTLVLKVKRGDAPAIDTRLRIARGGAASADASNKLHQTHERHSSVVVEPQGQEPDGQHLGRQPGRVVTYRGTATEMMACV